MYLVLDLKTGGDLRYYLRKKIIFSERDVAFYVACLSAALAHIHSMKVLHRDIKPENILLDSKGYPHLAGDPPHPYPPNSPVSPPSSSPPSSVVPLPPVESRFRRGVRAAGRLPGPRADRPPRQRDQAVPRPGGTPSVYAPI